ncbi:hypothetical protein [Rhodococcus sp. IEGM 1379]|uniref:hypothetical protein n=1 Tax=Rhodococcus sp. IEGM 1379 TaxID=3047086 RepID=UPI0024B7777A|nr:hypothetical protein [Rhodococcus sp. IEGM 1379]MDI9913821.1 hypothetical protein [Rhodococcus sp. IEGM 1379]
MQPVNDASVSDWIEPRLTMGSGTTTGVVPGGFDAYVRVLHPIDVDGDHVVRWRDVAATTGRTLHPLVQWWRLIDAEDSINPHSERWDGDEPEVGSIDQPDNQRLLDVLAHHTNSSDLAYFALWDGWGFLRTGATVHYSTGVRRFFSRPDPVAPMASRLIDGPRIRHPGRDYVVLSGSLTEASTIPDIIGARPWSPSANLVWPQDRSWCVATEVDFDSTLVGCSREAANEIVACSDLEAFPINPDDSLQYDADLVNR